MNQPTNVSLQISSDIKVTTEQAARPSSQTLVDAGCPRPRSSYAAPAEGLNPWINARTTERQAEERFPNTTPDGGGAEEQSQGLLSTTQHCAPVHTSQPDSGVGRLARASGCRSQTAAGALHRSERATRCQRSDVMPTISSKKVNLVKD